jgi:hypothetical protein
VRLSNSDEVAILDRADIARSQSHESLRATRRSHELDFKPVGRVDLDNSAQITTAQTMFGQVVHEDNGVEGVVGHGYSGNAVTNLGKSSPVRTIQTETMPAVTPAGPTSVARTSYF